MPVFALPPYFRNDLLHTQHYSRIPNQRRNLYHTQLRIEHCQCWNTRFLLDLEVPFLPANSISAICLLLLFNSETGILQSGNYLFGYTPGNGHFGDAMPQTCALSDIHLSDFQIGFAENAVDGFLNDLVALSSCQGDSCCDHYYILLFNFAPECVPIPFYSFLCTHLYTGNCCVP